MKPFSYTSKQSESSFALAEWSFDSYIDCETYVLPDGCLDFIYQAAAAQGGTWFISELSQAPYSVSTTADSKILGIRLQPGVELKLSELSSWLQGREPEMLFGSDQVDEFCTKSDNLTDALNCLASGKRTVLCVANDLGASLRSLQRLVRTGTGQTPYFWFSLARIRKAGRLLLEDKNLVDIAIETGFADQAHMNREMKRWFGRTPNQVKSDPDILDTIVEPGYG